MYFWLKNQLKNKNTQNHENCKKMCCFLHRRFSSFFCDFGVAFEVENNSKIMKMHSRNALRFPTSFRNRFFVDVGSIFDVSEPRKSCWRVQQSTISEKSPFSFPDLILDRFLVILPPFLTPKVDKNTSENAFAKKTSLQTMIF